MPFQASSVGKARVKDCCHFVLASWPLHPVKHAPPNICINGLYEASLTAVIHLPCCSPFAVSHCWLSVFHSHVMLSDPVLQTYFCCHVCTSGATTPSPDLLPARSQHGYHNSPCIRYCVSILPCIAAAGTDLAVQEQAIPRHRYHCWSSQQQSRCLGPQSSRHTWLWHQLGLPWLLHSHSLLGPLDTHTCSTKVESALIAACCMEQQES